MRTAKASVLDRIKSLGLLAVIRGPSVGATQKAVHALVRGGILGIEITYSTPNAPQVVRSLKDKYGDVPNFELECHECMEKYMTEMKSACPEWDEECRMQE